MEESEGRISRTRFLRQLGITLAAAVGAVTFARSAYAVDGNCCRNCSQCGTCLKNNQPGCYCYCDCSGSGTGTENYCYQTEAGCRLSQDCIPCPC